MQRDQARSQQSLKVRAHHLLDTIGDSAILADGLDMKAAAVRIHALMSSLGFQKAEVVGHDIGLMVAYAYVAMYPPKPQSWWSWMPFFPASPGASRLQQSGHLAFPLQRGPTPEALDAQRTKSVFTFDYFSEPDFAADKTCSIPEADRKAYAARLCATGTDESRLGLLRFL